ncbi:hypothetical protein lerEdw1_004948 [Lerista edwardsae]|nr:hypothetical protein lerEdw1_004948 [Lerista edwardsae]
MCPLGLQAKAREPQAPLARQIKYKIVARREGDVASCYADPGLAEQELGWKAERGLDKMCKWKLRTPPQSMGEDLWRWQSQNPSGFSKN